MRVRTYHYARGTGSADAITAWIHNGTYWIAHFRSWEKVEGELVKICEDILDVLDKHLIPSAASGESKVFYHKM